jgi:hypothetical protein
MSALGGTKLANPLTTNVFYGSLGSAKSFTFTLIALSICGSSQTRITLGVDVRHSRFATSDNAQSSAVSDRERGLVLGAARPSDQPRDLPASEPTAASAAGAPAYGSRVISGRLQVVVKKNRSAAAAPFLVGGCTPCSPSRCAQLDDEFLGQFLGRDFFGVG